MMKYDSGPVEPELVLTRFGRIKLYVRKEEAFVFYATYIAGQYDRLKIRSGDTVLDLGANVGDFAIKASKLVGENGSVIAVEPDQFSINILKKNIELNQAWNVTVINAAVSDREGEALLFGHGNSAMLSDFCIDRSGSGGDIVPVLPIRKIISEYCRGKSFILKLDIEGAERTVFKEPDFLNQTNQIIAELHGRENIEAIIRVLIQNEYKVSQYDDVLRVLLTIKNILKHPFQFISNELSNDFVALRNLHSFLKRENTNPHSDSEQRCVFYARRSNTPKRNNSEGIKVV